MKKKATRGKLFVISAPSGCGKTTLCKKLVNDKLGLAQSISVTTRHPRQGEKRGIDYRFVSHKKFKDMLRAGAFLEHEENFGNLYGTPRKPVEQRLRRGKDVLLSIDVKGAMNVKRLYPRESVLIFILPPSIAALRKRLMFRSADAADAIARRLKLAKKEISYKKRYDHTVVNDRLDSAYRKLKHIIVSESQKA